MITESELHIVVSFLLCIFMFTSQRDIMVVCLGVFAIGVVKEFLDYFILTGLFDWRDIIRNLIGIWLFLLVIYLNEFLGRCGW